MVTIFFDTNDINNPGWAVKFLVDYLDLYNL